MKKEDILSLIIYIGMLAIGVIVGFTLIQPAMSKSLIYDGDAGACIAFSIVSILVGIVINGLLLEFGHLVGAKLGGYEISSFNVFYFCFYKEKKEDGKKRLKFKLKGFDGLSGETQMSPKKETSNPMYFIFVPLVLILLEVVAMYCVFAFIPDYTNSAKTAENPLCVLKYGIIVVSTIGLMFALYNYFPAHLDSTTDGYRLTLLSKKINVKAYNEYLRILSNNLFDTNEEFKLFDEITDFTALVNSLSAYKSINNKEYDNAYKIFNTILESKKISNFTKFQTKLNIAYINFLTKPIDESSKYYKDEFDQDEKRYMIKGYSMAALRIYMLNEGLVEKSASEVEYAISKKKKILDKENPGLQKEEERLFNEALDFIKASGLKIKD